MLFSHWQNQWMYHQGKCGVCGDPYQGPRDNEAGGRFAKGIIGRRYVEGQTIDLVIEVTALHFGFFEFRICPNNNVSSPVSQACLDQHLLVLSDGKTQWVDWSNWFVKRSSESIPVTNQQSILFERVEKETNQRSLLYYFKASSHYICK